MNTDRNASWAVRTTVRAALTSVLVVGAALAPAAGVAQTDEHIGIPLGETPPIVQIEDLEGRPVDLGQYIGRGPVLVEFWALWCELCEALFPRMERAYSRHGSEVAFLVVAVAVNQSPRRIKRHLERHPMSFTVLWDTDGRATRAFQAPTTSYVVVLDADGRVAYTGTGGEQDIERAIARALRPGSGKP